MPSLYKEQPIGVFDSGFGGLTVLKSIARTLPHEDIVYLGDTARVPYGTRSARTVMRYAQSCARFLSAQNIKCLVVACNTVSAVALDVLSVSMDVPVLGVIRPGANAAVQASKTGRIGVVATAGTIASNAYVRAIAEQDTRAEVFSYAAPLWVPLVEEGWIHGEVPELSIQRYLAPMLAHHMDVLLLGCTHYPVLRPEIERYLASMDYSIPVIDAGNPTAQDLKTLLETRGLMREPKSRGSVLVQVTDMSTQFEELMRRFVGETLHINSVKQVDLT